MEIMKQLLQLSCHDTEKPQNQDLSKSQNEILGE